MAFTVLTDSSCSISRPELVAAGVRVVSLHYQLNGEDKLAYDPNVDIDFHEFYDALRNGGVSKTNAPTLYDVEKMVTPLFEEGNDILYVGFSSALSSAFDVVSGVLEEKAASYPNVTVKCVSSLAASLGEGLLVYYAVKLQKEGKTVEEAAAWLEENKLHLAHWFTVDDLMYLFRGGRVKKTEALAGTILNIKPVMHVDNEGRLIPVDKARGRKKSLQALADRMKETALQPVDDQVVFISHADALEDAEYLEQLIYEQVGHPTIYKANVDTTIGSHCGPGTIALFFMASER